MKVKAKAVGFYGGSRRYPGDVFEVPNNTKLGKWLEPIDGGEKPSKTARKAGEPETLSEMAKTEKPSKVDQALQ